MIAKRKLQQLADKAVKASFDKGSIDEKKAKDFISVLKNLPKSEAIFVLQAFIKGIKRQIEDATLVVESASDLSKEELRQIQKEFMKNHFIADIRVVLNPRLLGGLRIKIADFVYDYSLENKVQQLKGAIKA